MGRIMAAAKKTTSSRASKTGTTAKKGSTKGKTASSKKKTSSRKTHKRTAEEINTYKDQMAFETGITILVMLIISMFFYLCFFGVCGKVGIVLTGLSFGLFGWLAWILPLYFVVGYTFAVANVGDSRVPRKLISSGIFLFVLASLVELVFQREILTEFYTSNYVLHRNYFECLYRSLEDVSKMGRMSGGIVGRFVGDILSMLIGKGGAAAVLFAVLLLCLYIFHGLEMMTKLRKRNAYHQEMEEAYDQMVEEEDYVEPSYLPVPRKRAGKAFQAIDLKAVGRKLDQMESSAEEISGNITAYDPEAGLTGSKRTSDGVDNGKVQKADGQERKKKGRKKKAVSEETVVPSGMEEIGEGLEEITPNMSENVETAIEETAVEQIPIYREEMNQKFGKAASDKSAAESDRSAVPSNKPDKPAAAPMDSFAPKEEVVDVRPSSQRRKEEESGHAEGQSAAVDSGRSAAKASTAHGKIGGDDYVSQSATFNALNDSKVSEQVIPYQFPPIDLLKKPDKPAGQVSDDRLRETARRLQETLQSFHVNVRMGAVTCGPTVTRYEVLPEQGVRVNKITNLADDLKLSLAAQNIRIEAPIPGKSAVGIEVPNEEAAAVHFRELLQGEAFDKAKSPVTFAVGKDIAGKVVVTDIAKMPHLLIAGATGSGKSVCINTLIMSILYKSDPNQVKLIMIDPKVVELSCYNGIPHLFCPVVTDPKEAAASLNWAVREMMDRYNKFKELGVRNIEGYNKKIETVENAAQAGYSHMPFLVIIVDEFADLMMVASKDVEDAVCRLAQLARAAGIHLILATQRPSVNVITGVIKANIPSRIAFSVSSATDSRTILDKGGAEKLLGKGDMLFFPSGYSEPVRLQGAFVSDKEVSDVVDFLRENNETPVYNDKVTEIIEPLSETEGEGQEAAKPDQDEYFEEAGRFVIESERAAAGQLQRRFSIGFNRAGRIIDQLHKAGVVGPAVGTKPRQVLMTMEEFDALVGGGVDAAQPLPEEYMATVEDTPFD